MVKPEISVCIPTFNRGVIVKKTIENILAYKINNIEIIVSNNGSTDNTDELINSIKDNRLKYFKNDENLGFNYNLLKVLEYANSNFVLLLSDEDDLVLKSIIDFLYLIKSNQGVSAILGSVSDKNNKYLIKYKNKIYTKGEKAFKNHSFSHHYMSGIILNKNLIDFKDLWHEQHKVSKGFLDIYPHVYILNKLCLEGNVITTNQLICNQRDLGKPSEDTIGGNSYIVPKERINLFKKNIESLTQYSISIKLYNHTFIKLYLWTLRQLLSYNNLINNKKTAEYHKVFNSINVVYYIELLNESTIHLIRTSHLKKNQKDNLERGIKLAYKKETSISRIKELIKILIKRTANIFWGSK